MADAVAPPPSFKAAVAGMVVKEGTLLRRGAAGNWKRRYFVLTGESLDCLDAANHGVTKASLPVSAELNGFSIAPNGRTKRGHWAFTVAVGPRSWELAAETEQVMVAWMAVLRTRQAARDADHSVQVLVASWNVGNAEPPADLTGWIPQGGRNSAGGNLGFYDVIAVGVQESSYDSGLVGGISRGVRSLKSKESVPDKAPGDADAKHMSSPSGGAAMLGAKQSPGTDHSEGHLKALFGLVTRLQGAGLIADRKSRATMRSYKNVFVGREAVTWMCENFAAGDAGEGAGGDDDDEDEDEPHSALLGTCETRADAVRLCRELQNAGLIRHCNGEKEFEDGPLFFRIYADGSTSAATRAERSMSSITVGNATESKVETGDANGADNTSFSSPQTSAQSHARHGRTHSAGGLFSRLRAASGGNKHKRALSNVSSSPHSHTPTRSRGISLGDSEDVARARLQRSGSQQLTEDGLAQTLSAPIGVEARVDKLSSDHFFRTVQEHLGPQYRTVASFVEPTLKEMRQIIFVHTRYAAEDIEATYANTGIGGVLGNKGGLATKLSINGTSFGFVSCHLAPHAHKLVQRAEMVAGVLQGARVGHRKLQFDSQLHHVFFFGDLNYRVDLGITDRKWVVGAKGAGGEEETVQEATRTRSRSSPTSHARLQPETTSLYSGGQGADSSPIDGARSAASSVARSVASSISSTREPALSQTAAMDRLRTGGFRTRGDSLQKDCKDGLEDSDGGMSLETVSQTSEDVGVGGHVVQTVSVAESTLTVRTESSAEILEKDSAPSDVTQQEQQKLLEAAKASEAAAAAAEEDRQQRQAAVSSFLDHARGAQARAQQAHVQALEAIALFQDALRMEADAARAFVCSDMAISALARLTEEEARQEGFKSGKAADGKVVESHPNGIKLQREPNGRIVCLLPELQALPDDREDEGERERSQSSVGSLPSCQVQYNPDGVRMYAPDGGGRVQKQPPAEPSSPSIRTKKREAHQVTLVSVAGGATVRVADFSKTAVNDGGVEGAPAVVNSRSNEADRSTNLWAFMYPNAVSLHKARRANTGTLSDADSHIAERVLTTRLAGGDTVTAVVPVDFSGDIDFIADSMVRVVSAEGSTRDAPTSAPVDMPSSSPVEVQDVEFNGDGSVQLHGSNENTIIAGTEQYLDSESQVADPISDLELVLKRSREAINAINDAIQVAEETGGEGTHGAQGVGPRCSYQDSTSHVTQLSSDGNIIKRDPEGDVLKMFEPHAIAALAAEVVELSSALQKVERAATAESFSELMQTLDAKSFMRASRSSNNSNAATNDIASFHELISSTVELHGQEAGIAEARKAKQKLQARSDRAQAALVRATSSKHGADSDAVALALKGRRGMDFDTLRVLHDNPSALIAFSGAVSGSEEDEGGDDDGRSEKDKKKEMKRKMKQMADLMHAQVSAMLRTEDWDTLYENDQLHNEIECGRLLHGFQEMQPRFLPTFKVKRHVENPTYNEKRVPSWCDRILWRSLEGHAKRLRPIEFNSAENITTSDHKPVFATFEVELPSVGPEGTRLELAPRPLGTSPCLTITNMRVDFQPNAFDTAVAAGEPSLAMEDGKKGKKEKKGDKEQKPKAMYVKFYTDPPDLLGAGVSKMPRTEIASTSGGALHQQWSDKGVPPLHLCVRNEAELKEAHLLLAVFSKESNKRDKLLAQAPVHLGALCRPTETMDSARSRAASSAAAESVPPPPPPPVSDVQAPPPPPLANPSASVVKGHGKKRSMVVAPMSLPAVEELRLRAESAGQLHRKHVFTRPLVLDGVVRGQIECQIDIQWPLSEISLKKWLAQTSVLSIPMALTIMRKLQESGLFAERRKKKLKTYLNVASGREIVDVLVQDWKWCAERTAAVEIGRELLRHRFMEKASAGDTFKDSASSLYSVASVSQKFTS